MIPSINSSSTITSSINYMTSLPNLFCQYFIDNQDPRTVDYQLINVSSWTIIAIMSAYLVLTTRLVPKWMENRRPFELRSQMFVYNCLMVFINGFFFLFSAYKIDFGRKLCQFEYPRIDNSPLILFDIFIRYLYWLSKFADLADTFFFSLRKKSEQISFLHLYHHTVVPIFGWLFLKMNAMVPGVLLFMLINSFIHVLMYSYYALAAFGPSMQKYLWWKRYITLLQLIQFMIYAIYGVIVAMFQTGYPTLWLYFGMTQPPFFFYMFYDFYRKAYRKKKFVNSSVDNTAQITKSGHQVSGHDKQK